MANEFLFKDFFFFDEKSQFLRNVSNPKGQE